MTRDLDKVKCVKDGEGKVLVQENDIKGRWKTYFDNSFNEGYDILQDSSRLDIKEDDWKHNYNRQIQKQKVKEALKRMSNSKTVEPNNIPIEMWKFLEIEVLSGSPNSLIKL